MFYNGVIMIKPKNKYMNFRWHDYDYEYWRKVADREDISVSEVIRRALKRAREIKEERQKKHD